MSLSSKTELARALFRSTPPDSVTRISGTATADSADGTVTVQLEDGDVIEVGTIGSVSSGDTVTIHVQRGEAQVIAAEGWGDSMQRAVDEAAEVANAVNQHFWSDTNGAHVTEVTQEDWNDSQSPNYHAGHNILMNSLGILLRKALNYLGAWTGSAIAFYDGEGNEDSHITAMFGKDGAQVGAVGKPRLLVSSDRLSGVNADDAMFFDIDYNGATSVGYSMANGRNASLVLLNSIIGGRSLSGDIQDYADVSAAETGYTIDTTRYEIAVRLSSLQDVDSLASSQNCLVEIVDAEHLVIYPIVSFEAGTDDQIVSQAVLDTTDSGTITITTETSYDSSDGSVSLGLGITTSSSIPRGGGAIFTPKAVFACPTVTTAPAYTLGTRQPGHAAGDYSAAIGEGIVADEDHQAIFGKYNSAGVDGGLVLAVGIGTDDEHRANAFEVLDVPNHGVLVYSPGKLMVDSADIDGAVSGASGSFSGAVSMYGTAMPNCFSASTVSHTIGSVSANGGTKTLSFSVARTGYRAIAISGWYLNGASTLNVYMLRLNGTNCDCYVRNPGSTATSSSATVDVQVLYCKNSA